MLRAYDAIQRGDLNYAEEVLVSLLGEDPGPPETRADARDAEDGFQVAASLWRQRANDLRASNRLLEADAARLTKELEEARADKEHSK